MDIAVLVTELDNRIDLHAERVQEEGSISQQQIDFYTELTE